MRWRWWASCPMRWWSIVRISDYLTRRIKLHRNWSRCEDTKGSTGRCDGTVELIHVSKKEKWMISCDFWVEVFKKSGWWFICCRIFSSSSSSSFRGSKNRWTLTFVLHLFIASLALFFHAAGVRKNMWFWQSQMAFYTYINLRFWIAWMENGTHPPSRFAELFNKSWENKIIDWCNSIHINNQLPLVRNTCCVSLN